MEIFDYQHHFLDEENKHMIMFGEFCRRYGGKIYPEKKLALPREYAEGEEDVSFYTKILVVEEVGDVYNLEIMRDERVDPIVREVNRVHHLDEARHIAIGRQFLAELWQKWSPGWPEATRRAFQEWLADYLRASWRDFYNPSVYRDAGLEKPFQLRQEALASPVCRAHRERVSRRLVSYFLDIGMLAEEPAL
jgi:hypothetical protein